jgi:nucleoside-diphosphate-sugar epimerase
MNSGLRVLVTGGAGFIGSHVVDDLVREGYKVRVYDNFSSGLEDNLRGVRNDVEVVKGDILDEEALARAMRGIDVVSHQAAQLEITLCVDDPVADLQCNTVGTLNVLKAAVKQGVQKIINASSACVYGQAQFVPEAEATHPTNPNWAYGVSKLAAEKYCQVFSSMHNVPIVSFRYSIVYGPREWYGRVLTLFLKRVLEGNPPVIFGSGSQIRDFIYVGDVVRANRCALEKQLDGSHSFNVSTGIGTSVATLAEKTAKLAAKPLTPICEDVAVGGMSSVVVGRVRLPAELERMVLDNQLAKSLLGWKPEVCLDQGLETEFTWLAENPERWTRISI